MRCEHLVVWQRAVELVTRVYRDVEVARGESDLVRQMRSAAVSIASNIAEGCQREGDAEFAHFLSIACGSCAEVECQLRLGKRIGALRGRTLPDIIVLSQEVGWMLRALGRRVRSGNSR
ncbi:MAG: four helix bundle protein [Planctomycetes bacterium]|nr:four helix bundle protein [Planctomycetota bacterium]